jgi:hypothetical protein
MNCKPVAALLAGLLLSGAATQAFAQAGTTTARPGVAPRTVPGMPTRPNIPGSPGTSLGPGQPGMPTRPAIPGTPGTGFGVEPNPNLAAPAIRRPDCLNGSIAVEGC